MLLDDIYTSTATHVITGLCHSGPISAGLSSGAYSILNMMRLQESLLITGYLLLSGYLVAALKDVRLSVPAAVKRGDTVLLFCHFDLEGDSLYTVKWYKGRREFYRFTPIENPPMKIFPIEGLTELDVEKSKSNATQLCLKEVVPSLSGRYSCEVSADAPSFHTALVSGDMDVVVVPKHRPTIQGIKPRYRAGDTLRANCTSPGSRPAANLTWVLNGQQVDTRHVKVYRVVREPSGELETSTTILELPLQSHHFNRQGRLKLKCTASLHSLYWQTTEKSAEEERPRTHLMHNDVIESNDVRHNFQSELINEDESEKEIFLIRADPSTPAVYSSNSVVVTHVHMGNVVLSVISALRISWSYLI